MVTHKCIVCNEEFVGKDEHEAEMLFNDHVDECLKTNSDKTIYGIDFNGKIFDTMKAYKDGFITTKERDEAIRKYDAVNI